MISGFNIDAFRATHADLARQYTFIVLLNNPFGSLGVESTKFLVTASSLPGSTIEKVDIPWQGNLMPLATTHTFEPWNVTFRCDSKAQVRKDMLAWHDAIHDPRTNVHAAPSAYMQDQEVWQLNTSGDPILKMRLIGAWPTTITEMTMDYMAKEVCTFDVTFEFIRHEVIG